MRTCPECGIGKLEPEQISEGCECSYCHKIIEIDVRYSWGIPIVLALFLTLAFRNDYGLLGSLLAVTLIVFASGYKTIWTKYLPIKYYGD